MKVFSSAAAISVGAVILATVALFAFSPGAPRLVDPAAAQSTGNDKAAIARAAFERAAPVFLHPRCANCHPRGDRPLQTDKGRPHAMNVLRGPDGLGVAGLRCSACHNKSNLAGRNMPPGAAHWQMPRAEMPMAFAGLSPGALCRQLKDQKRNGGRDLATILKHVTEDSLVIWAWNPGAGRTPVPQSHAAFVAQIKLWIDNGAACPS